MHKDIYLIPEPKEIKILDSYFIAGRDTITIIEVVPRTGFSSAAHQLSEEIRGRFGIKLSVRGGPATVTSPRIIFRQDGKIDKGFVLEVTPSAVTITAKLPENALYAVQTLLQLLFRRQEKVLAKCCRIRDWPSLAMRGLHVALWDEMFRPDYFADLLKKASHYKINTLLLEYLDKFPYRSHPALVSPDALKRDELKKLLALARERNIEIIPQFQCIGHVDYILCHKEYAHLREDQMDIHKGFCPLNPGLMKFYREAAKELMAAHPGSRYFHIGGDEWRSTGQCPRCRQFAAKHGLARLYVDHVRKVSEFVKASGKIPIVWDDMLFKYKEEIKWLSKDLALMSWDYSAASNFDQIDFFQKKGFKVIGAACVREGESLAGYKAPVYEYHIPNVINFARKTQAIGALGLVTTNWSPGSSPYEISWFGNVAAAEYSWSGYAQNVSRDDFERKFLRRFYGLTDYFRDERTLLRSFYLLSKFRIPFSYMSRYKYDHGTGAVVPRHALKEKIKLFMRNADHLNLTETLGEDRDTLFLQDRWARDIAKELLGAAGRLLPKAESNKLNLECWIFAARYVIHKTEQVELINRIETAKRKKTNSAQKSVLRRAAAAHLGTLLRLKADAFRLFQRSVNRKTTDRVLRLMFGEEEELFREYKAGF